MSRWRPSELQMNSLQKLFSVMSAIQAKDVAAPPPTLVSPPPPTITTPKVTNTWWIKPSTPNNFDGGRAQSYIFLTLCKLYMLLMGLNLPYDHVCIHWAPSFFISGCVVTFAKRIVRQEMKSSQMIFIHTHSPQSLHWHSALRMRQ
jgi:hypothetical protein